MPKAFPVELGGLKEIALDYYDWRNAVFNQPIQDLEKTDFESEAFCLNLDEAFDHIDRALIDDGLYSFEEEQLVIGFSLLFGKTFTDYPFCYTRLRFHVSFLSRICRLIRRSLATVVESG